MDVDIKPFSIAQTDCRGLVPYIPSLSNERRESWEAHKFVRLLLESFPELSPESIEKHFNYTFIGHCFQESLTEVVNDDLALVTTLYIGKKTECVTLLSNSLYNFRGSLLRVLVYNKNSYCDETKLIFNKIYDCFKVAKIDILPKYKKEITNKNYFLLREA